MKGYHDMGGNPGGAIDRQEKELTLFEKRSDALLAILWRKKLITTDETRRALESLGAEVYLNAGYAERRIMAIANNLILKGIITVDELAAKLAEIEKRTGQLP
jgi:hypothetical protein